MLACFVVLPLVGRPVPDATDQLLGLTLLQAWTFDPSTYFAGNGPSWSLSCELFFYAVLPPSPSPSSGAARGRTRS